MAGPPFVIAIMLERAVETRPWTGQARLDDALCRRQIAYLPERSPFHRDKLGKAGLRTPRDIGGLDRIAVLPLTEKVEIRASRTDDVLIVRGVNVFPSAIREVVGAFAPAVGGMIEVRPRAPGVKQERLRASLVFAADIEIVPWGTLRRSEYKSKLVRH